MHAPKTNESALVELSDGRVLQAMRSYHGKGLRALSVSADGGATWGELRFDEALRTPVCQASLLRLSWPAGGRTLTKGKAAEATAKGRILFASPHGTKREALTLWTSEDDGKTWALRQRIYEGSSAYSCLVALDARRAALFFERDGYKKLSFTRLSTQ